MCVYMLSICAIYINQFKAVAAAAAACQTHFRIRNGFAFRVVVFSTYIASQIFLILHNKREKQQKKRPETKKKTRNFCLQLFWRSIFKFPIRANHKIVLREQPPPQLNPYVWYVLYVYRCTIVACP